MANRKAVRGDLNQIAASIVEQTTSDGKNAAAVALGRLGGLKGGKARAEKLSAQQRSQIARKAAKSRWKQQG
jgi:ABC-type phosphate/phosphonate transport system ATPase subunit